MIIPAITGGQGDQMTEYPEGQEAKDFLAGSFKFQTIDIEVFCKES